MNYKILPNGDLRLTAGNQYRADLAECLRISYVRAESHVAECFLDRLTFIAPEAIGALTASPILTDDADYSEEVMAHYHGPEPYASASVWWFPDYQVIDPWKRLARTGRVIFTSAGTCEKP